VVSLHGAKIRFAGWLLPQQQIRLLNRLTGQEALFRVVSKVEVPQSASNYWGVERLDLEKDIWGVQFPELQFRDQSFVRAVIQCSGCMNRELLDLDEPLLISAEPVGGLVRGRLVCGKSGLWKTASFRAR